MKTLSTCFIIALILSCAAIHAIPLDDNWMSDYDRAKILAAKHKRSIVLVFSATWCKPCKLLKKETLEQPETCELLKNHLRVRVDIDEQKKAAKSFGVRGVPCVIFLNAKGEELDRFTGYVDHLDFEKKMDDAYDPKQNLPSRIEHARESFSDFDMQKELLTELLKRNAIHLALPLIDEQIQIVKEEDIDWKVELLAYRIRFFVRDEQNEKALSKLKELEKQYPEYADEEGFYITRAKSLLALFRQKEAVEVLEKFVERFPTSPDAHWARQVIENTFTGTEIKN